MTDDLITTDFEYTAFVEGAKKYCPTYERQGLVVFPHLGLHVSLSGNETKFYFGFHNTVWGRLWTAKDALLAVKAIDDLRQQIDSESMEEN